MPSVFALLPDGATPFLDSAGDPADGFQLFVYEAGSSTKATTYQESDGVSANTNPIVLDARGETPYGVYVESGTYKLVWASDTDTDPPTSPIRTRDDVSPINDTATTVDQWVAGPTPTQTGATTFTLAGDQTTAFHAGRRLKLTDSGGTDYGFIQSSVYSDPTTTVTVSLDSGSLDSGLSAVSYALVSAQDTSAPMPDAGSFLGFISGGICSNNGADADHDIDITACSTVDTSGVYWLRGAAATIAIDGGTGIGAVDDGVLSASTVYYIWLLGKTDGTTGYLFSTASTLAGVNKPTGYTLGQLIGSVRTDGTSDIRAFIQVGDEFTYADLVNDVADNTISDGVAKTDSFSVPASCMWRGMMNVSNSSHAGLMSGHLWRAGDTEPSGEAEAFIAVNPEGSNQIDGITGFGTMLVSADSQMSYKATESAGTTTVNIHTQGFRMLTRGNAS